MRVPRTHGSRVRRAHAVPEPASVSKVKDTSGHPGHGARTLDQRPISLPEDRKIFRTYCASHRTPRKIAHSTCEARQREARPQRSNANRAAADRRAASAAAPQSNSRGAHGCALAELLGSALPRSRAKREREAVREVGRLRGRRIAEVSLGRLRALPQTNLGCPLAAQVEDPERALARSQSYAIRSAVFRGKA
jgi:hypothetical protein